YLTIEQARENKLAVNWTGTKVAKPQFIGKRDFINYPLEEIAGFIDWTPLFHTWEMPGKFPAILSDEHKGTEATKLYNDAQKILQELIQGKLIQANAVVAFYPANALGHDDIELYTDESRKGQFTVLHTLRQQSAKAKGLPNIALSDFIAPAET